MITIWIRNIFFISLLNVVQLSRILVVVPTPSISHQVVFYPLIKELVKKGHEVVFVTTNAMHPKGQAPANLTEIDTHDKAYEMFRQRIMEPDIITGNIADIHKQFRMAASSVYKSFEMQVLTTEFQDLVKNKTHFDLLILEAFVTPLLALSHVFKAPVILMSSSGSYIDSIKAIGAPWYPRLLYPDLTHQKVNNLSLIAKIVALYQVYQHEWFFTSLHDVQNELVKRLFGPDVPSLKKLADNVQMLFLNIYPLWEHNRPVPSSVIFIGGIHEIEQKELPKELKTYLDNSKRGVVYLSLGTNVSPSTLASEKIQNIVKSLSRLPYDVLMKWDNDKLPVKIDNIRVSKWLPQADLLRHPNIKAFITQGGLQSFDEALTAGVPMVGTPMLSDQWYNVEQYVRLNIGIGLLMEELTEEKFVKAVNTVIQNPIYRTNMIALREKLRNQPTSALDRAVWWTEHVLKYGGSHLRAPAANISWAEYLDIELMLTILLLAFIVVLTFLTTVYWCINTIRRFISDIKMKCD